MTIQHYHQLSRELEIVGAAVVKRFRPTEQVYRIYEYTEGLRNPRPRLLSVSKARESWLQEEIACGRKLITLRRMIFETSNRDAAALVSDRQFL